MSVLHSLVFPAAVSAFLAAAGGLAVWLVPVSLPLSAVFATLLFIAPAPQVLMLKKGLRILPALSWAVAAALLGFIFSWRIALVYGLVFALFALCCHLITKADGTGYRQISSAVFIWSASFFLAALILRLAAGASILEEAVRQARMAGALSIGTYYDLRIPAAVVEKIETRMIANIGLFRKTFIGFSVVSAFAGSWFISYISGRKAGSEQMPPLEDFRMPEFLIWGLIFSAAVLLLRGRIPGYGFLSVAASNTAALLLAGYLVTGSAILLRFLSGMNVTSGMKVVAAAVLILFFRGVYVLTAAGILDVWLDFRKRAKGG